MTVPRGDSPTTPLDHLIGVLRARDVALDGQVRPAAVLWTDPESEWRPLVPLLLERMEELVVLGEYEPARRTGPAIWLRCVVDRTLDEPTLPEDRAPVVYLPGVGRQQLKAGEACPPALRPLVELLYRGTVWIQHNGADWTVAAYLGSSRSLGLDLARDRATREALLRALPELMVRPLGELSGRRLEAEDFDRMLAADVVRDVLLWMGDPEGTRARLGGSRWEAFRSRCREELDLDPERDPDVVAGERLGRGEGAWARVWQRFAEAPSAYPGIADLLRRSRPGGELLFDRERWPHLNDEDETALREALAALEGRPHGEVRDEVLRLEREHGPRRGWVWAQLGQAPLARVLEPLARLARAVETGIGGPTPDDMAAEYVRRAWTADLAALEALAQAQPADEALVAVVVRDLLEPWLDRNARAFQEAVERAGLPTAETVLPVEVGHGECLLFADGLRYDLGCRLAERLRERGAQTELRHRWAALPTVTATAKPAVTPLAGQFAGDELGEDMAPVLRSSGRPAAARELRKALEAEGFQLLDRAALAVLSSDRARGWLETGEIDSLGHKVGARLASQLDAEVERLAETILHLLDAGWEGVRVVTDHGWLLLPGGLPKVELPKHLTATRWARCAVPAGEYAGDMPRFAWFWNPVHWFATPPGIACFNAREEYAHGGLSLQECLIPELIVERSEGERKPATITSITWRGFRCFVEVSGGGAGLTADLHLEEPETGEERENPSVVAAPRAVGDDGTVSLVVRDDSFEERPLVLVLLDSEDRVVARRRTRVGEDA